MKITTQTFLFIAALFLLLPSCKTPKETDSDAKTYACTGSNPFWKAKISSSGIEFSLLGGETIKYPYRSPVETSERKLFVTSKEVKGKKSWLKISIVEGACSTSSTGRKFPLKVELDKDDVIYYGCGE